MKIRIKMHCFSFFKKMRFVHLCFMSVYCSLHFDFQIISYASALYGNMEVTHKKLDGYTSKFYSFLTSSPPHSVYCHPISQQQKVWSPPSHLLLVNICRSLPLFHPIAAPGHLSNANQSFSSVSAKRVFSIGI